ncbi:VCBS repeat-containing protein [Polaribacter sp.]|uniref:VCBS repeat-containing protein n=1 Tax=Polaribacter sp. TaxID=1920175 RepID=UPI003F6D0C0E
MKIKKHIIILFSIGLFICCVDKNIENNLFESISAEYSGINFKNQITTNDSINIVSYEYLYNGGGVGVGDFNNDNLPDIIFSGNQVKSRIYINKGNLTFKDITSTSGINTQNKWCTGVSIVDINQDGYDDIYLNIGGLGNKSMFPNLLYINNGDLTFTESAVDYGLADQGESIQSLFFDYDKDGDLDMYLLTGGGFERSAITIRPILKNGESRNTDRLYRNDFNEEKGHPVYTNVSKEAGITIEGFGLGVTVFDANNDKWPDIYVSNDYLSRDFLYVNQQNGTFKEDARNYFGHTSHFSMGNDVADINNDGLLDVVTVDMLPEDVKRRKLMSGTHHSHDVFQIANKLGYGHQQMRNMLQVNNGNNNFSEIGQFAGIDKTDWSWAPLIADFDNDGLNDIFITNGFGKDITDMDFVKYREKISTSFGNVNELKKSVIDCLYHRPSIKIANYAFRNKGNSTFEKINNEWGFNEKSISNGAIYSDLDNDGDLDLIVNNINETAFVYKNKLREKDSIKTHYLKVKLKGNSPNKNGKGATLTLTNGNTKKIRYNQPIRGFQSSVGNTIHFGLNNLKKVDTLKVEWPNGATNLLIDVSANQTIVVSQSNATRPKITQGNKDKGNYFALDTAFQYKHQDRSYNDFATQSLLLKKYSSQGPAMAVGDLNNDGLEDVFIGGTYGFNSAILYQEKNGDFKKINISDTELYEDGGALIFDADGNGYLDLYITSGGTERYAGHKAYQDRIYYNFNGQLKQGELPEMLTSTSTVSAGDFDNDGDLDLFVGGRIIPGKYPLAPKSYILENDNGNFENVTDVVCPLLNNVGMVTSATWTDFNNDTNLDLVIVGEFMPITILKGNGSKLENITQESDLKNSSGLWNSIVSADFDNDGDIDFVVGNLGLNSNLKVKDNHPIKLDFADFDNNSSIDPIFSKYEEGNYYPIASLDQLVKQLPILKKKFLYYNTFAKSTTEDVLSLFGSKTYETLQAEELKSSYVENLGNNKFKITALPNETQIAPINGILTEDMNQDGFLDILLVGNDYGAEVGMGKYDASIGHVVMNNKNGTFTSKKFKETGFYVLGDAKSIVKVHTKLKPLVLVGVNNENVKSLQIVNSNNSFVEPHSDEAYAIIIFKNGSKRKHQFSTSAGGYLSQTSNKISVNTLVDKIDFYSSSGKITREVNFD